MPSPGGQSAALSHENGHAFIYLHYLELERQFEGRRNMTRGYGKDDAGCKADLDKNISNLMTYADGIRGVYQQYRALDDDILDFNSQPHLAISHPFDDAYTVVRFDRNWFPYEESPIAPRYSMPRRPYYLKTIYWWSTPAPPPIFE